MNAERTNQTMAHTSLVLGILSVIGSVIVLGILAGIPAIVTGHIARKRARRFPGQYGGAGLARAGLVMGYFGIVLTGLVLFLNLAKLARSRAESVNCANTLVSMGCAARMSANDNHNVLVAEILSMSNELVTPKILLCPSDKTRTRATNWSVFGPRNSSYEYLAAGVTVADATNKAIFRCPVHGHTVYGDGHVVSGDGTVQYRRSLR